MFLIVCLFFALSLLFITWHNVKLYHYIVDMFSDLRSCVVSEDDVFPED